MSENEPVELALNVSEQRSPPQEHPVWEKLIEIIVLALIAIATAWSGYQAAI
jgi:hypothetical protein